MGNIGLLTGQIAVFVLLAATWIGKAAAAERMITSFGPNTAKQAMSCAGYLSRP